MFIILFAGFAFLGGIFSSLLGWLGSAPPEPFIPRKFMASVLKAFISAAITAGSAAILPPVGTLATVLLCITAFIAGVGIDAGAKRIVDAATVPAQPTTPTTSTTTTQTPAP